MYKTILVTLDTTPTDRAIIEHIKRLAKLMSSRVVLLHVASSAAARWHGADAAGKDVKDSEGYLARVESELEAAGIAAETRLEYGEPFKEIVKWVEQNGCDLVAMSTHGHKLVADMLLGTTASKVQHSVSVPVLMLRAK